MKKSTAALRQLGLTAALCAGIPGLAGGQSGKLVPFIGVGGAGALISYGSIQDVGQSRSNWGLSADAGLSWWFAERLGIRGSGGFAWHGRARVPSCIDVGSDCVPPITFTSQARADLVTGSLDLLVARAVGRSSLLWMVGGSVARQSGHYILEDRTAVGVRAGMGFHPSAGHTSGLGFEVISTRYFTSLGGVRWAFSGGVKFGF